VTKVVGVFVPFSCALHQEVFISARLTTVGFGETTPVATCGTAAGKALNRRTLK
jgi:outer membrane protein OmpA-like peptidoglycan-associated protein